MISLLLAGVALVGGATSASASPPVAARPSGAAHTRAALAFDVNGPWTDNGSAKPVITTAGGVVVIDMSYAHRPTAVGAVIDTSSILVTFPDAGTYIGTFVAPTVLRWSNGSIWQKVYTGQTLIDLNDDWTDGRTIQHVSQVNGFISVDMSALHRPRGTGFVVSPSRFVINFPDDRNTTFATLRSAPDAIVWSNGSQWVRVTLPGNPNCLVLC